MLYTLYVYMLRPGVYRLAIPFPSFASGSFLTAGRASLRLAA